jgi:hypothetical protein
MTPTRQLASWFQSQCQNGWEEFNGVSIESRDDPGWMVSIDLADTSLAGKAFKPVKERRSEEDWIECSVAKDRFVGKGGAGNLDELITVFLDWAG